MEEARNSGRVITGGEVSPHGEYERGTFVKPTVVEVPTDNWLFKRSSSFRSQPSPVDSLDDAIELANESEFGLTAGSTSGTRPR